MHKTGSTAIQSAFNGYDDGLLKYADFGYENHSIPIYTAYSAHYKTYHIWQNANLSPQQIENKRQLYRNRITQEISQSGEYDLLISGEDISLLSDSELCELQKAFEKFEKQVVVIVYVRSPISFIRSNYQEVIKNGLNPNIPPPPNYRFRIEKFVKAFGHSSVIVRPFSRGELREHNVVEDFSQLIGVAAPRHSNDANTSLSTEATRILYQLNEMILTFGDDPDYLHARNQIRAHVRCAFPGSFEIPLPLISGLVDEADSEWLYGATNVDFRLPAIQVNHFSESELNNYFNMLEPVTINKLKEYLNQKLGLQKFPENKRSLLAHYFMSFLRPKDTCYSKFDQDCYLRLNPDVKEAGMDPYQHYLQYGRFAGRRIG
ncbi:hypothetical protein [Litoreibacter arenae]|nr:hypothetical protein [Litoreibacter arenae]